MPTKRVQSGDENLQIGLVGAAGSRADAYRITFDARDHVTVKAVCDVDEMLLTKPGRRLMRLRDTLITRQCLTTPTSTPSSY